MLAEDLHWPVAVQTSPSPAPAATPTGAPRAPDARQQLGRDGEEEARTALRAHGYVILAERYRVARGEIDIVARDGDTLVFVEVKTWRSDAFGGGSAAVTWRKQRTIVRVAEAFLREAGSITCRAGSTW